MSGETQVQPGTTKAYCYLCERYFTFDELDEVDYVVLDWGVAKPNNQEGPAEYWDSGSIECPLCKARIDWVNL